MTRPVNGRILRCLIRQSQTRKILGTKRGAFATGTKTGTCPYPSWECPLSEYGVEVANAVLADEENGQCANWVRHYLEALGREVTRLKASGCYGQQKSELGGRLTDNGEWRHGCNGSNASLVYSASPASEVDD